MVAPAVGGIDLFKIASRSISGWIKSLKMGTASHVRQPFCSQLEERLLLWLEYHPQVASYARGDIRTRTLSPRNGVLRFPAHSKRKTRTSYTEQRWAMEKTVWEVVAGESK